MFRNKVSIVISLSALVIAVFGATPLGQAAAEMIVPKGSVGTKQLKKAAVTSLKVKDGSLLAADFKAGQLPAGPQGPKGDTGPAMPIGAALTRMAAAARTFNVGSVRERDLAMVAAVAPSE